MYMILIVEIVCRFLKKYLEERINEKSIKKETIWFI